MKSNMNSKQRWNLKRREAWIAERRNKPYKAYNGTDCPIANLVLILKSAPDKRKQPRLRKPSSEFGVTARG
ncbi:hypothetical protein [Providencia stuartii]|uniref:hypothetical protein n=1 Tax=Providencia stuartii TaxID=588 RepID=UPI001EF7B7C1|nr:hypothetical protein [Providencia stuartii]